MHTYNIYICLHYMYYITYIYTHCDIYIYILNFTSSWDFVIFRGILDIKVKMQYLVQSTRLRVAPKKP